MKVRKLILFAIMFCVVACCSPVKNRSTQTDLSFEEFFEVFSTDSIFQIDRISFPLKCKLLEFDGEYEVINIKKEDWKYTNFLQDTSAFMNEHDKFKQTIQKEEDNNMLYIREGIDNGIYIEYLFIKKYKKWFLVEIEDSST